MPSVVQRLGVQCTLAASAIPSFGSETKHTPNVGIEPTTTRLRVVRSTDWANWALLLPNATGFQTQRNNIRLNNFHCTIYLFISDESAFATMNHLFLVDEMYFISLKVKATYFSLKTSSKFQWSFCAILLFTYGQVTMKKTMYMKEWNSLFTQDHTIKGLSIGFIWDHYWW